jgi:hypothetical protein
MSPRWQWDAVSSECVRRGHWSTSTWTGDEGNHCAMAVFSPAPGKHHAHLVLAPLIRGGLVAVLELPSRRLVATANLVDPVSPEKVRLGSFSCHSL